MTDVTIFSDFLRELGVRHTSGFSNGEFHSMPFNSLFGLSKLLDAYNIRSRSYMLGDKSEMSEIAAPFLAQTGGGFVIVTSIDRNTVGYLTQGVPEKMPFGDFVNAATGVVLCAFPDENSVEPDYSAHRRSEIISVAKKWILLATLAFIFLYLFIANGIGRHVSTVLVTILDMVGLYMSYLIMQKSLNIDSGAVDNVCKAIEAGGCDSVLATKASKFFGIFGWSEVGFAYFSVSLLALLIFPQYTGYLALCNVCCLPFSFWSVWYQKYRAKAWCTLCLSVQGTLWLLFFCYLGGGWLKEAFPLTINFFVLGASYLAVLLLTNRISPLIDKTEK